MVQTRALLLFAFWSLLGAIPSAFAHGDDHHGSETASMEDAMSSPGAAAMASSTSLPGPESYFTHHEMSGYMLGHIALMVVAWFFILPIGERIHR